MTLERTLFPVHLRSEWLHLVLVFFATLSIYLWSAPRTVVLEDDGIFILAAYFNGVAHPPGYPLYTLLGKLATLVPVGSIAYRVHALSALFGASACACLWWFARCLIPERKFAYVAGLGFGFSQTFWSQAIIAEIYTLNVLLFFLLLNMALQYSTGTALKDKRLLILMAFIYGLSLSNHWPLMILSTPALLIVLWPRRRQFVSMIPVCLPFILLGLLPYVWMVFRSQMEPAISFYGALNSWSDFWFTISRAGYSGVDSSLSAGWWDKWHYEGFILGETTRQFGPVGIVFVVIGFLYQWRIWPRTVTIGLTLGYLCNTFLLIILLGFDYEEQYRLIIRVYPLIAYGIAALWLALGVYFIYKILINFLSLNVKKNVVGISFIILIVATTLMGNIAKNYRAADTWAEDYARIILESLRPEAVLFTYDDLSVGSIGYLNLVENVRPDIALYNRQALIIGNRLYSPFTLDESKARHKFDTFINDSDRPVYYIGNNVLSSQFGGFYFGLYFQVNKVLPAKLYQSVSLPLIEEYFESLLLREKPMDAWESQHYRWLLADYCRIKSSILLFTGSDINIEQIKSVGKHICRNYPGKLALVEILLNLEYPDLDLIHALLNEADMLREQAFKKEAYAKLDFLRAKLQERMGDRAGAIESLELATKIWHHPDNPANVLLTDLEIAR